MITTEIILVIIATVLSAITLLTIFRRLSIKHRCPLWQSCQNYEPSTCNNSTSNPSRTVYTKCYQDKNDNAEDPTGITDNFL